MNAQEQLQLQAVKGLTEHIPLNDFGLPIGVYRTDLLPFHNYQPDTTGDGNGKEYTDPNFTQAQRQAQEDAKSPTEGKEQALRLVIDDRGVAVQGTEGSHEGDGDDIGDNIEDLEQELLPPIEEESGVLPAARRVAGFLQSELEGAFVRLYYDEGFPAFVNGQAFWEKFEFEPIKAYIAFEKYLQLSSGTKPDPEDPEDIGREATGARSISELASQLHPDGDLLKNIEEYRMYSCLYFWGLRARSYDLFRVARHRKQQELRAIETQDEHYITARKLMNRLAQYFDEEEDFWDMLTPKVGIDMFKTLTALQRVSSGLPATGPIPANQSGGMDSPSLEVILRQVANADSGGNVIDHETQLLEKALADPEMTDQVQELIIRLNKRS